MWKWIVFCSRALLFLIHYFCLRNTYKYKRQIVISTAADNTFSFYYFLCSKRHAQKGAQPKVSAMTSLRCGSQLVNKVHFVILKCMIYHRSNEVYLILEYSGRIRWWCLPRQERALLWHSKSATAMQHPLHSNSCQLLVSTTATGACIVECHLHVVTALIGNIDSIS